MKLFKFTAVEYNRYPMFREGDTKQQFPCYHEKERYELPPMQFEDLWDAEEWFVKTFPQYCIGYSVVQIDEDWRTPVKGGDFAADAVLDYYVRLYGGDIEEVYKKAYEYSIANFENRKQYH